MYLGESADYLDDVSWEEEGFLLFGNESRAEKPEFSSDKREDDEEDIIDHIGTVLSSTLRSYSVIISFTSVGRHFPKNMALQSERPNR